MVQEDDGEVERLRARLAQLETRGSTTLSGLQFIVLVTFVPMVIALVVLGVRIVWSASDNPEVLDNMEGLLVGLAIFSIPVSAGLGVIMGALSDEIKARLKRGANSD